MKRIFTVLTLFVMLFALTPGLVGAAPAPALTDVQIVGVASSGTGYSWEFISNTQTIATKPVSGSTVVLKIFVKGTQLGSIPAVYYNGTALTTSTYQNPDYATDSTGTVIGKYHYRSFSTTNLASGNGTFRAQALNYYPPNNAIGDNLVINVLK